MQSIPSSTGSYSFSSSSSSAAPSASSSHSTSPSASSTALSGTDQTDKQVQERTAAILGVCDALRQGEVQARRETSDGWWIQLTVSTQAWGSDTCYVIDSAGSVGETSSNSMYLSELITFCQKCYLFKLTEKNDDMDKDESFESGSKLDTSKLDKPIKERLALMGDALAELTEAHAEKPLAAGKEMSVKRAADVDDWSIKFTLIHHPDGWSLWADCSNTSTQRGFQDVDFSEMITRANKSLARTIVQDLVREARKIKTKEPEGSLQKDKIKLEA